MTPASYGLEMMLAELEGSCLEVVLIPQRRHTNEGGMIRVAASKNALWYRNYCARHLSSRLRSRSLPDTRIKRRATVATLRALINGRSRSKYAPELVRIASRYAQPLEAIG